MRKLYFIFSLILIFILSSCDKLKISSFKPIYAMDTTISITFYNDDNADEHYKYLKNLYQEYSILLDNYNSGSGDSNLYDLNNNRSLEASDKLKDVIVKALELKEETNGYFNPLIGRLAKKWKDAFNDKKILDEATIIEELAIMNSSNISIEGNVITIVGDANIDLGGFAKGYVTKLAMDYLKEENVEGYLINAGESTVCLGKKGNSNFKVSLVGPYDTITADAWTSYISNSTYMSKSSILSSVLIVSSPSSLNSISKLESML